ncbi:VTC domain-containing protein [Halteromyces radiatus]|uniref:VTC domain-containing protein n=1 Tax=Halteromyces radiatus TaxID=101107 RepID=UPI0022202DBF|nr:VTC domain-containing protein [Halteromyces radiatus]KAI8089475.1 VTC domain-containing protein [Halteromyces radiatus]
MKYGLELQENIFAPWRLSYIAYDVLKQELKTRQLDHSWTDKDENDFVMLLDNELTKVYDFVNAKLSEIDARILYCERTIQTLQKNSTMHSDANYRIMDEALTEILFDVNDLSKFTRVNFLAIQKILKKHDKWTGLDLKHQYVSKLREKPLDKQRFDVAIVYISALHDICRHQGKSNDAKPLGGDQNAFERATAKYWIHPDNITEVKAIIMLHLPVLIFNKSKKFETSDAAVSSVYFDNRNFDLYTGRLQRDEEAEAIRFRWYGPYDTNTVFIERKTHHASWLDGASVKDRFPIKESRVNSFVDGSYTADMIAAEMTAKGNPEDTIKDMHFTATGVQKSFREKGLESMLRVYYNRTAFQLPDDQKLRISLDTDLTFIREDHIDGRLRHGDNWRRTDVGIDYPFNYVAPQDILRFPYAVLETKLQTHLGQEPPQWLTSLIESHLVHEVPRFSKYLHGACHFYREKLPLLPWWLSELNNDIRKGRVENTGLTRSRSFKPLIDGQYRRAMLEEKERKNSQAVVEGRNISGSRSPSNNSNDESTKASSSPMNRRRSNSIDEKVAAQWRPVDNPPNKQDYTSIELGPTNHGGTYDPLLPPSSSTPAPSKVSNFINNNKNRLLGTPVDEPKQKYEKAKVKVRAEPKVFFANERTFISWLQFCALLLTVALNLLNFGDYSARIAGGVFLGISAFVAIYALYRFEKRAYMINRQIDGRYDDLYGPAVLCVLLVGALIVNFYLRFR